MGVGMYFFLANWRCLLTLVRLRRHALGKKKEPGPVILPNPGLGGSGIRMIFSYPFHFRHLSPLPVVSASRRMSPLARQLLFLHPRHKFSWCLYIICQFNLYFVQ
jgi:hypothetical protein